MKAAPKHSKPSFPRSPGRRRFLRAGVASVIAGLGTPAYASEVEPNHPVVTRQDIRIKGWPADAAGLTIGQLSDLHVQDSRALARSGHAVQLLLEQKPDMIVLTGDYISGGQAASWSAASADALAPLWGAPRGVFAILGNHDYAEGRSEEMAGDLEQAGFIVLRNDSAPVPGVPALWVVGLESRSISAQDPVQALSRVPDGSVKILLVHEPDYADEAPAGFALQLSGHSHAGQIRVPGLPPLCCPRFGRQYPEGLQRAKNHPVYTSRGVGMMGPQMRFCCPPEITLLTIYPA